MAILGCIADDFTGATDLANTLTREGMATVQINGLPEGAAPKADALVVALKCRSIEPALAIVHLHATHSVAVFCLEVVDPALAGVVETLARDHHAPLLQGRSYRCLTAEQQAELAAAFPS